MYMPIIMMKGITRSFIIRHTKIASQNGDALIISKKYDISYNTLGVMHAVLPSHAWSSHAVRSTWSTDLDSGTEWVCEHQHAWWIRWCSQRQRRRQWHDTDADEWRMTRRAWGKSWYEGKRRMGDADHGHRTVNDPDEAEWRWGWKFWWWWPWSRSEVNAGGRRCRCWCWKW